MDPLTHVPPAFSLPAPLQVRRGRHRRGSQLRAGGVHHGWRRRCRHPLDLDGLITSLGPTRPVIVVAHAMGGPIAATWAGKHGADARALLLLDPLPPGYFGPGGALVKALPHVTSEIPS